MSAAPTIQSQLLDAIDEPSVRLRVSLLLDSCILAVKDLDSLDRTIYEQSQAAKGKGLSEPTRPELEKLADSVLDGIRKLVAYLSRLDVRSKSSSDSDDMDMDMDLEFDMGGGEPAPQSSQDMTLSDDDIADALDGLAPEKRASTKDRWEQLSAELVSLSYALSAQLKDFDERFKNALDSGRFVQGLRALDDVGNSLIDGMFALMSTVCETYLDEFDRDQMLPGHRDTLGKALLVRRGLAELRQNIGANNRIVQDTKQSGEDRQAALDEIAAALAMFLRGEVFNAMRPADRIELDNFHAEIADHTVKQAAMSCEGLDKYLDSLASVSERDVLIKHDSEVMNEVAELLESVGPLIDISPHGAIDMVRQAFARADELYGYRDDLDSLLAEWGTTSSDMEDPAQFAEISKRLGAIVGRADT